MSELYFKKEIVSNFILDDDQNKIEFEITANDIGVKKLDSVTDAKLVSKLNDYADRRVGGVVRISAEIYEAQKKSEPVLRKSGGPFGREAGLRAFKEPEIFPSSSLPTGDARSAAAAGDDALNPGQTPPRGFGQFRARSARSPESIPPPHPVPQTL